MTPHGGDDFRVTLQMWRHLHSSLTIVICLYADSTGHWLGATEPELTK